MQSTDRAAPARARSRQRLARAAPRAQILHTDDFASWNEPLNWWPDLEASVLEPLARGELANYPSREWLSAQVRGSRTVEPDGVVILEGVSSARASVAERLTLAVWIAAPGDLRMARGLDRDGEAARLDWERWMAEEDAHFAADGTAARADIEVDGAPRARHDPATEFVRLR